jgi:hypothetical protein
MGWLRNKRELSLECRILNELSDETSNSTYLYSDRNNTTLSHIRLMGRDTPQEGGRW